VSERVKALTKLSAEGEEGYFCHQRGELQGMSEKGNGFLGEKTKTRGRKKQFGKGKTTAKCSRAQ